MEFTRSRPYHSDDNAHVEQKNWTWARQLLGYGRLEDPELVAPISALYREVWAPWQNFFLPCLKLEQKWRVSPTTYAVILQTATAWPFLALTGDLLLLGSSLRQCIHLRPRFHANLYQADARGNDSRG